MYIFCYYQQQIAHMSIQIPASLEKQEKFLNIVHCIPVVRHEGRFYVFL